MSSNEATTATRSADTNRAPTTGRVRISTHPLLLDKLRHLRPRTTPSVDFRRIVREMSTLLGYEALADLQTDPGTQAVAEAVLLVPVLRAGLGMVDAVAELVPHATVHLVGMYRDPVSLCAVEYYNKLPSHGPPSGPHRCLVLDPVLATGHTVVASLDLLKTWGAARICIVSLVASRQGIAHVLLHHPDVDIIVASVDETLDAHGYLVPGIGDAGDRIFNTSPH